mgnify:CR=1 FL=1
MNLLSSFSSTQGLGRHGVSGEPWTLFAAIAVICLALSSLLAVAPYLLGGALLRTTKAWAKLWWRRCTFAACGGHNRWRHSGVDFRRCGRPARATSRPAATGRYPAASPPTSTCGGVWESRPPSGARAYGSKPMVQKLSALYTRLAGTPELGSKAVVA